MSGIVRSPVSKQAAQTSDYIKQTHRSKAGHYDAWGGQGLDEVISGAQKRGEMYEIHQKLMKKRELKQKQKEMGAGLEAQEPAAVPKSCAPTAARAIP